jgi:hypothetical protein
MANVKADFSQAKTFELLPQGPYPVRIVGSEIKTAKKSGNEYIAWTLEIFNADRGNGRKIWLNTSYSGKGAGMLKQLIESSGVTFNGGTFDTDALHGKEVLCYIKHEKKMDSDDMRETVARTAPLVSGGASSTSLTPESNFESFSESRVPQMDRHGTTDDMLGDAPF